MCAVMFWNYLLYCMVGEIQVRLGMILFLGDSVPAGVYLLLVLVANFKLCFFFGSAGEWR